MIQRNYTSLHRESEPINTNSELLIIKVSGTVRTGFKVLTIIAYLTMTDFQVFEYSVQ
jgi:hypothetical protein